jgi:hypothetical protein
MRRRATHSIFLRMNFRRFGIAVVCLGAVTRGASAQTYYRNLDAGQPGRVEDAEVTPRYSLAVMLAPLAFERLSGGSTRYRAEPKMSYGFLPRMELEIRVPMVELVPPTSSGAASTSGVAGVSIGLTRAITIETGDVPAFAVTSELSLPVGSLAGSQASFMLKGLATKTLGTFRLHVNAGGGTYSVGTASQSADGCSGTRLVVAGDTTCSAGPIVIFDAPCARGPVSPPHIGARAAQMCMAAPTADTTSAAQPPSHGARWFAGAGLDHAFPLRSTLLSADIFAERFVGLYALTDWTAEVGLRHQLSPIVVIDAGVGRHFAGVIQSTFITTGVSFAFATPAWAGQ